MVAVRSVVQLEHALVLEKQITMATLTEPPLARAVVASNATRVARRSRWSIAVGTV